MRQLIKNSEYFRSFIAESNEMIQLYKGDIADNNLSYKKKLAISYAYYQELAHNAIASFTTGNDIPEVRDIVIDAINALDIFTRMGLEDEQYFLYGDGGGYSGGVSEWLRDLSFCILFDLPREKSDIVLDHLSLQMRNPEQATDALVNKMVKYLGYPGQDETDHLIWPEAYAPLYACFGTEANRADQLKSFVDNWYREMGKGDAYWHDNHKNKHDTYFGYWTFEAAAVAKMLHINDAALRDHPHYPYEARHG